MEKNWCFGQLIDALEFDWTPSWWFQPICKTLVKFGSFPQVGVKFQKMKPPPRLPYERADYTCEFWLDSNQRLQTPIPTHSSSDKKNQSLLNAVACHRKIRLK